MACSAICPRYSAPFRFVWWDNATELVSSRRLSLPSCKKAGESSLQRTVSTGSGRLQWRLRRSVQHARAVWDRLKRPREVSVRSRIVIVNVCTESYKEPTPKVHRSAYACSLKNRQTNSSCDPYRFDAAVAEWQVTCLRRWSVGRLRAPQLVKLGRNCLADRQF